MYIIVYIMMLYRYLYNKILGLSNIYITKRYEETIFRIYFNDIKEKKRVGKQFLITTLIRSQKCVT